MDRDRSGRGCWRIDALQLFIKQSQDCRFWLYHCAMAVLPIQLDRARRTPLATQIYSAIRDGIDNGRLASGARLPSWQDLAAQLGVARGTVRSAYEKLSAAQLIVASRATGTHVAARPSIAVQLNQPPDRGSFMEMYQERAARPGLFRIGVPA